MPSLMGIDNGLTVTKAVIIDISGNQLAVARRRVPQILPHPRWVERDMDQLWQATCEAIKEAIQLSDRPSDDIKAVAATAHGDGLYLLDQQQKPLGNGILSLDSRALDVVAQWEDEGLFTEALECTGQTPHASAPSALLAWIKTHQPERFAQIGTILAAKDWLRYCLCDALGTDKTEASISFTNVRTQQYDETALDLYGLGALKNALPPIALSYDTVGQIHEKAAEQTGLAVGTQVAAGIHDVTATALGMGAHQNKIMSAIAGTYSINQIVSESPSLDARWFCRNAAMPKQWNNMSISPASATNYDWFIKSFCQMSDSETELDKVHTVLADEFASVKDTASSIFYHPFLFGSPHGAHASASFLGLQGWHTRADMVRALFEGIIFNHRTHIDALETQFEFEQIYVSGGIARNPDFVQLFADILQKPVRRSLAGEPAAFGAALCAGVAAGFYKSLEDDPRPFSQIASDPFMPSRQKGTQMDQRFEIYSNMSTQLNAIWRDLARLNAPTAPESDKT